MSYVIQHKMSIDYKCVWSVSFTKVSTSAIKISLAELWKNSTHADCGLCLTSLLHISACYTTFNYYWSKYRVSNSIKIWEEITPHPRPAPCPTWSRRSCSDIRYDLGATPMPSLICCYIPNDQYIYITKSYDYAVWPSDHLGVTTLDSGINIGLR